MRISLKDYQKLLEGLLASGMAVTTRCTGKSMCPSIQDGETVRVEPVKPGDIRIGDIVLFRSKNGRPLLHRVARLYSNKGQRMVITWGDACCQPDKPVPTSNVLGRIKRGRCLIVEYLRIIIKRKKNFLHLISNHIFSYGANGHVE